MEVARHITPTLVRLALAIAVAAASAGVATPSSHAVTWTQVASGTTNEIRGIEYQSDSRFWFATAAGEIFRRKTDGSFERTANLPGLVFEDVAFQPSGDIGVAIAANGTVYRSGDAGASWQQVTGVAGSNSTCTGTEPLTAAYSVRWAGNDVVYVFAGDRKLLRSPGNPPSGAPAAIGNWYDANLKSTNNACKAGATTSYLGLTDGYFAASTPNRGWLVSDYFGEVFFANDITTDNTASKTAANAGNGTNSVIRLAVDNAQPNRQWAITVGSSSFTSQRATTDAWQTVQNWTFTTQQNYPRGASEDIAARDGTVVHVGRGGLIEDATVERFRFTPAGGSASGTDWKAVDLADAHRAAVGGAGGALIVSADVGTYPDTFAPSGDISGPVTVEVGKPAEYFVVVVDTGGSGTDPSGYSWSVSGPAFVPGQTGDRATFTFPQAGNYTIVASWRDFAGNVGQATKQVTVTAAALTPTPTPRPAAFSFGSSRLKALLRRDSSRRRIVVITVRGILSPPAGVSTAQGCPGRLNIAVRTTRRVARGQATVAADCRFRKTIRFLRSKVRGRRVTVFLEFPGNSLIARSEYRKKLTIRAG